MSDTTDSNRTHDAETEAWLPVRKDAAQKIDPETAKVTWVYANIMDPYGVDPQEEYQQYGREFFARVPGSDIWVWFGDLPACVRDRLLELHRRSLFFPAGLHGLSALKNLPMTSVREWIKSAPRLLRLVYYALRYSVDDRRRRSKDR